jgi:hypothetical protein
MVAEKQKQFSIRTDSVIKRNSFEDMDLTSREEKGGGNVVAVDSRLEEEEKKMKSRLQNCKEGETYICLGFIESF